MYRLSTSLKCRCTFTVNIWWKNPFDHLLVYLLKTVSHIRNSLHSEAFLTLQTIQQACEDEKNSVSVVIRTAKTQMYVYDFLGVSDLPAKAPVLIIKIYNIFRTGGFQFRKWDIKEPITFQYLPYSLKDKSLTHSFNFVSSQRTPRLEWNQEVQIVEKTQHLYKINFNPWTYIWPLE